MVTKWTYDKVTEGTTTMGDLDEQGLRDMILAYSNQISTLRTQLEGLEAHKRNLEMQLGKLIVPVTIVDYKGPKPPAPAMARCHLCGAKTRERATTQTGFLVAECSDCQLEAYAIAWQKARKVRSATEQNVG